MKRISVSFVRTARWLANSRDGEEERTLGVAMAMQVLRECPALRIEDLVNIFPDFTTIDHLKARASCPLPPLLFSPAAFGVAHRRR